MPFKHHHYSVRFISFLIWSRAVEVESGIDRPHYFVVWLASHTDIGQLCFLSSLLKSVLKDSYLNFPLNSNILYIFQFESWTINIKTFLLAWHRISFCLCLTLTYLPLARSLTRTRCAVTGHWVECGHNVHILYIPHQGWPGHANIHHYTLISKAFQVINNIGQARCINKTHMFNIFCFKV